jgi:anionic cell wall polymer biosynthesis LytR-Cps2A-Psr (LCP) family protein
MLISGSRERSGFVRAAISTLACCLALLVTFLVQPALPAAGAPGDAPAGLLIEPETSAEGNLLLIWTDDHNLKAVTLLTFYSNQPVGIVSIPLYICLDTPQAGITVADAYYQQGRTALTSHLEERFKQPIRYYVTIDQASLRHMSEVMGTIGIGDKETTLMDVFEGKHAGHASTMQTEIRGLAANLLAPSTVVKLPQLVWIYSSEVDSNLGPRHVLGLYQIVKLGGPGIIYKKAIPGVDYRIRDRHMRQVEPNTWADVLEQVSRSKRQ